jgi:PAS domain S-box-containing protein/putative nucleotidyltransferase with HDIG domain
MKNSLSYNTERKRTEEELRNSEERLKLLFEYAPDAYYLNDLKGHFIDGNKEAERTLGYKKEELIGKSFLSLKILSVSQLPKAAALLAKNAMGKSTGPDEFVLHRKDGSQVIAEIRTYPIKMNAQTLVLGIARDITERKQAEEEQRQQDKKFRAFVETTNEWIWSIDQEGKHTFCNPALETILGYSPEEFVGKDSLAYICDEDRPKVQEMLKQKNSGKEGWSGLVLRWRHKDGSFRSLESTAVPVLDQAGELVGYRGADRDITERKKAEEALRQSEEYFRFLIEKGSDVISVMDKNAIVHYISPSVERILGYKPEELIGMSGFALVHPDDLKRMSARQDFLAVLGAPGSVSPTVELRDRHKDGSWLSLEVVARSIVDANGELAIVTNAHDITERKQAEESLRQSMIQLRTTLKASINALASAIEMRDPYTTGHQERVTKLACAIAREIGLSEDQIECIQVVGIIHDIGKIYVPAEILSKPGKLNEFEFMIIKTHSQVGCKILSKIEFPWPIADIVHQHHERVNGSGYPQRLIGKDILLEAKILGVADVVEAMSSHRPYRPALGSPVALEEISRNKGVLYDPLVADACLKLFAENKFKFE